VNIRMRPFGLLFLISILLLSIVNRSFSSPNAILEDDMHFLFKWPGALSSNLEQVYEFNLCFIIFSFIKNNFHNQK
jgi:hypothetical protein